MVFRKEEDDNGRDDRDKAQKFIQRIQVIHQAVQEKLEKSQARYKARHDKHRVDHQFQVGDKVWLHINKERMKGEGKKLRPIRYGPFTILAKIGDNDFHLDFPAYMQMYSVVNVENLKLYGPPLIMDTEEVAQFPTMDDFAPEYLDELPKDIILDKKTRTSRRGDVEYIHVGFKGMHSSKSRWMEKEKLREKFPHLPID